MSLHFVNFSKIYMCDVVFQESEGSGKEEEHSVVDDNEWEPPSKRKRGPGSNRYVSKLTGYICPMDG